MRNPISHDTQCVCVCVSKDTTRKRVARQLNLLLVVFSWKHTIALPVPQPLTFSVLVNGLDFYSILQDYWNSNRIREFHISLGAAFIGRHRVHTGKESGWVLYRREAISLHHPDMPTEPSVRIDFLCAWPRESLAGRKPATWNFMVGGSFTHVRGCLPVFFFSWV